MNRKPWFALAACLWENGLEPGIRHLLSGFTHRSYRLCSLHRSSGHGLVALLAHCRSPVSPTLSCRRSAFPRRRWSAGPAGGLHSIICPLSQSCRGEYLSLKIYCEFTRTVGSGPTGEANNGTTCYLRERGDRRRLSLFGFTERTWDTFHICRIFLLKIFEIEKQPSSGGVMERDINYGTTKSVLHRTHRTHQPC